MHATIDTTTVTSAVRFVDVEKHFGAVKAVDGVYLSIAPGEFFAMLGPSGSGKTTCLRLIAGFEQPDAGHIEIFGETVEGLPPYRRAVNTVFQDYALFPHLSVGDNVAYGLRVRGVGRAEREKLAREALAMVKLAGMETRRPAQLSGGQRQRVALARALVVRPKVLLLDEPLGALDLKLREEMQVELKGLQRALGLTFVFVTHDQGEALSMADRVAVFNEGRIVQVGPPEEVYERPATRFVAGFVGSANVLSAAEAEALGGAARPSSLRPEKIALLAEGQEAAAGARAFEATVFDVSYQGPVRRITARTPAGIALAAVIPAGEAGALARGDRVRLAVPAAALQPMEGEVA
ncbi:ABC transporter ATP-binding protein [Bosea sp. 117]|uniref:ABC transporter ATP-binding protein n=1 Tax=Bosea sp. 117 TaxID=1125973 RepID=UPI000B2F6B0C|nr:ABC transporter ATP-binding protein [Bosea sp. 117]